MQTRRLYYADCHLAEFSAVVVSCEKTKDGWLVELDQTAFYPEGGGQASDLGTLGNARVNHVSENGEAVVHLCDAPLTVGGRVDGRIEYARRFDLMQQHTGEHIVSGLIHGNYGLHNVGFHMGADVITIDFDGEIPAADLPELERRANEAIWRDIPLRIWIPSPEELPNVFYRTKRALDWPVRIVEVPGYDACACCGVHVERTGEVGLVKLLSVIRFRTGVRMEMLCGGRALEYLSRSHEQNQQVSHAFSAKLLETGEAARKMNDTLGQMKARIAQLERQIFASIASRCAGRGNVLIVREGLEPTAVRTLADLVAEQCGGVAAVFSGAEETGYSYCLVTRQGDLRQLGRELNQALSGRGGGKPNFQAGSVRAGKASIEAFFGDYDSAGEG